MFDIGTWLGGMEEIEERYEEGIVDEKKEGDNVIILPWERVKVLGRRNPLYTTLSLSFFVIKISFVIKFDTITASAAFFLE